MKIRTGFVSNSSSSSFIVVFDKKPESVDDVEKSLNLPEHVCCYDNVIHGHEAARRVFSDIEDSPENEALENALIDLFTQYLEDYRPPRRNVFDMSGYSSGVRNALPKYVPEAGKDLLARYWDTMTEYQKLEHEANQMSYPNKRREAQDKAWKVCDSSYGLAQELAVLMAKNFIEKNKDKFIFITEYEDHSSFESIMEHGDVFRNIENIRISHH